MSNLTYQDGLREGMESAALEFASEMRAAMKDFEKGIILESDFKRRIEITFTDIVRRMGRIK